MSFPPDRASATPPAIVLIVDDSAVVRHIVTRQLRGLAVRVVEAESVGTALEAMSPGAACALVDLELPDGSGTDIARHLSALVPPVPVAFFTSTIHEGDRSRARTLGPVFDKGTDLDGAVRWVEIQVASRRV